MGQFYSQFKLGLEILTGIFMLYLQWDLLDDPLTLKEHESAVFENRGRLVINGNEQNIPEKLAVKNHCHFHLSPWFEKLKRSCILVVYVAPPQYMFTCLIWAKRGAITATISTSSPS